MPQFASRRHCLLALVGLVIGLMSWIWPVPAHAQEAAEATADQASAPQIRLFIDLLDDPQVRNWLERQREGAASPAEQADAAPMVSPQMVSSRIDRIRTNLSELAAALPLLPSELERVWTILLLEFQDSGLGRVLLLIAFFIALGFAVEWIYRRMTRGLREWVNTLPPDAPAGRVRDILIRLAYGIGGVIAFALGSVGAFLPFRWPPLLRDIVLGYLLAFLALRLALAVGQFLLAPPDSSFIRPERFRVLPMTDQAARFWHLRFGLLVGWFAFGNVTVTLLGILGLFPEGQRLVAYALGLGLLAVGLETVWRRPRSSNAAPARSMLTRPGRDVFVLLASV
jgi:hypothetical protein